MGPDDPSSRRTFLKLAAGGGIIGAELLAIGLLKPDPTNGFTKRLAESIRGVPGLGFPGAPVAIDSVLGGEHVTLRRAPVDEPGYWVGAPAMASDSTADRILVHVRHRNPTERGHKVTLNVLDPATWRLSEEITVGKDDLDAISLEGGAISQRDGTYRWFLSYQSKDGGDWRIRERHGPTIASLAAGGTDLGIRSRYFHHKDPAFVDDSLYVTANSRGWTNQAVERVHLEGDVPATTELASETVGSARVTAGHVTGDEVFVDVVPNLPLFDVSNLLWTSDERIYPGTLRDGAVTVDESAYLVSRDGRSIKYLDVLRADDDVYLLWQAENDDGSNDLVGTRVSVAGYDRFLDALDRAGLA